MEGMDEILSVLVKLKARGWTTAAIADAVGVSWLTVWRWETGRSSPSNSRAVWIALSLLLKRKRVPKRRRVRRAGSAGA
jgi:transcriptional regulator with XRE-family HTH domain